MAFLFPLFLSQWPYLLGRMGNLLNSTNCVWKGLIKRQKCKKLSWLTTNMKPFFKVLPTHWDSSLKSYSFLFEEDFLPGHLPLMPSWFSPRILQILWQSSENHLRHKIFFGTLAPIQAKTFPNALPQYWTKSHFVIHWKKVKNAGLMQKRSLRLLYCFSK